jgi:hypothetical protein
MKDNFTHKANPYTTKTPYEVYLTKTGDCNDFATFGLFIANYHEITTYNIIISYENTSVKHSIAIYDEGNTYSFSDNMYFYEGFSDFKEIVISDSITIKQINGYIWSSYIVYDYNMNLISSGFNI